MTDTQITMFETSIDEVVGRDRAQIMRSALHQMSRIQEELRIGQAGYDRLLPDKMKYESTVKRYRGIKSFTYRHNKFEAEEARGVVRFLKNWESERANLEAKLSELEFLIKGSS